MNLVWGHSHSKARQSQAETVHMYGMRHAVYWTTKTQVSKLVIKCLKVKKAVPSNIDENDY